MVRLGVNIDHIATLRQARGGKEPDPLFAAGSALLGGADGITVHLRGDRRHIKERDLHLLREVVTNHLNLEMAVTDEMKKIAIEVCPDAICLVPERKEEITTEGGLNLKKVSNSIKKILPSLRSKGILLTAFLEPEISQIDLANKLGFDSIEINTKSFSEARKKDEISKQLKRIKKAAEHGSSLGLEIHAGHGLNYWNVRSIVKIKEIVELNIGHAIIARSVFIGLEKAVREMINLLNN